MTDRFNQLRPTMCRGCPRLRRHLAGDHSQIMGDHAPAPSSLHPGVAVIPTALQPLPPLALTVVAALQAVGLILAIAMLITPEAIGDLLTDRFDRMIGLLVGAAVLACVFGVYASFHLDA